MGIKSISPYLPKSHIIDYLDFVKRSVAYRVWRRRLEKDARITKKSSFKFLEVGCGPGYFLRCLEKWFPNADLYGLDSDKSLIDFASGALKRVTLLHDDGHILPFSSAFFDIIGALQVIEHLENPETFLKEANRVLKTRGILLLSTPNPDGICAKILGNKWQGIRHDHVSLKTPKEWREIFHKAGFVVIREGTTGLTGFGILKIFPFSLLNHIPMLLWGFFPWDKGESYMVVMRKFDS